MVQERKIKHPDAWVANKLYKSAKEIMDYIIETYSCDPPNTIPGWGWDLYQSIQMYESLKDNGYLVKEEDFFES